jgi:hypothetical protein
LEETVEARSREPYQFRTAGHGVNLFQEIWKHEQHVFMVGGKKMGQAAGMHNHGHPDQTRTKTLNQHPVEVLAIDESEHKGPKLMSDWYWVQWMD